MAQSSRDDALRNTALNLAIQYFGCNTNNASSDTLLKLAKDFYGFLKEGNHG